MNKKEFFDKISTMQNPIIEEHEDDNWEFLNVYWVVSDSRNFKNKFITPWVRLTHGEYAKGIVNNYNKRVIKYRKQYERWLEEYFE
jgi:hypothetical protein